MREKKIYLLSALVFLSLLISVSALNPASWDRFGGFFTYNTQSSTQSSSGLLNVSNQLRTNISFGILYDSPQCPRYSQVGLQDVCPQYEPVITQLIPTFLQYQFIIPHNRSIQVYDKNLTLLNELFLPSYVMGQIAVTDFDGNGVSNDIVFLTYQNSTTLTFNVYNFTDTMNFDYVYQTNVSTGNISTGISCVGGRCSYVQTKKVGGANLNTGNFNHTLVFINRTSTRSRFIYNSSRYVYEVPSWADADGDGTVDVMTYDGTALVITDLNFVNKLSIRNFDASRNIRNARMYRPDLATTFKIVYLVGSNSANVPLDVIAVRIDGSSYWSATITGGSIENYGLLAITNDYDGDGREDVYALTGTYTGVGGSSPILRFRVYKGSDGSILATKDIGNDQMNWGLNFGGSTRLQQSLTLARVNDLDTKDDFIFSFTDNVFAYDIANDRVIVNRSLSNTEGFYSVIPADINFDGYTELIASGDDPDLTLIFSVVAPNFNAVINSVTFDPSIAILNNTLLNVSVGASDFESDQIFYSHSCSYPSDPYTADTLSSSFNCIYPFGGNYNLTIRVRDIFHSNYTYFSQAISVSDETPSCNFNNICELGLGETFSSCPSDCTVSGGNVTVGSNQSSQSTGFTFPVSSELVDVDTGNTGLLPSIYSFVISMIRVTLPVVLPFLIFISFIFVFIVLILLGAALLRKLS